MAGYLSDVWTALRAWADRERRIANLEAALSMIAEARAAGVTLLDRAERDLERSEAARAADLVRLQAMEAELAEARRQLEAAQAAAAGRDEPLAGMNVIAVMPLPGVRGAGMADLIGQAIHRQRPGAFVARAYVRRGEVRFLGKAPREGGNVWAIIER